MNSALKSRIKHAGKNTPIGRKLAKKTRVLHKVSSKPTARIKRNLNR